jgi:hypothetical protein
MNFTERLFFKCSAITAREDPEGLIVLVGVLFVFHVSIMHHRDKKCNSSYNLYCKIFVKSFGLNLSGIQKTSPKDSSLFSEQMHSET